MFTGFRCCNSGQVIFWSSSFWRALLPGLMTRYWETSYLSVWRNVLLDGLGATLHKACPPQGTPPWRQIVSSAKRGCFPSIPKSHCHMLSLRSRFFMHLCALVRPNPGKGSPRWAAWLRRGVAEPNQPFVPHRPHRICFCSTMVAQLLVGSTDCSAVFGRGVLPRTS